MNLRVLSSVLAVTFLLLLSEAHSENWPGWRGPQGNGVASSADFPTSWNRTKNIKWKFALPGKGGSTPAVWENSILLTLNKSEKNSLLHLDRTGKKVWQIDLGKERAGKHRKASGCNPSPCTDGELIFAYFKSGDLACVDFKGKVVWQTNLQDDYGEDTLWWDLGTSPVLTKNHVVVACMQSPPSPSYLAAFEKKTGKLVWKQSRELNAPEEAAQSYSTPVVITHQDQEEDQEEIIVLGADHVTAHDATTGKELWRAGGLNPTNHHYFRSIASPVVSDNYVIAPYARGKSLTAIKLGGQGDVTKSHVAWKQKTGADVPTPAAVKGKVYNCTDKGEVTCFEIKSGKELWTHLLEKNRNAYSSSPILAGNHIYLTREDGTTFVLRTDKKGQLIAKNELDESTVATPVLVDGLILIRTFENLYCIGK